MVIPKSLLHFNYHSSMDSSFLKTLLDLELAGQSLALYYTLSFNKIKHFP